MSILLTWFSILILLEMTPGSNSPEFLWRGPLPSFILLPVMSFTLLALAFSNFKRVQTNWRMGWRNLLTVATVLALTVALTLSIYHRAWEKLTPFEPPHGVARLSADNPVQLTSRWGGISVRLPNGRIWAGDFVPDATAYSPLAWLLGNVKVKLSNRGYIGGSIWVTADRTRVEWTGIKSDGTLWVSEAPQRAEFQNGIWRFDNHGETNLVRFGDETNWSSIATFPYYSYLVKKDGTLWRWGATNFDLRHRQWPGLRTFTPEQMGTESNWAEVYQDDSRWQFFRKKDGDIWVVDDFVARTNGNKLLTVAPGLTLVQIGASAEHGFRSTSQIWIGLGYRIGVRDDGTFRIYSGERLNRSRREYEWAPVDAQIGDGTNWLGMAGGGDRIVTLRDDGTLWLWSFHNTPPYWNHRTMERVIAMAKPVRLGTHADWIAVSGGRGNVNALAADGSLWFWPLERDPQYDYAGNDQNFEPLLDFSRKPQYLGNVFAKSD
jgi:hypothetical protein